jgi:hypothetical protein
MEKHINFFFILVFLLVYSSALKLVVYVPSKRRLTFTPVHGVIFQKIELFRYKSISKILRSLENARPPTVPRKPAARILF